MEKLTPPPLFIDLDGTYTKSDLLFESLIIAFKTNPTIIFLCIIWLLKGKANLKYQLAKRADIDTSKLPLNQEFVNFLHAEKVKGRKMLLATAASEKYANSIVTNSDIFDGYISSSNEVNLSGKNKLKKIKEISENFSYAGNDIIDFEIFKEADESLLVNPSKKAKKKAHQAKIDKTFDMEESNIGIWLKQLRIHQWVKNLLIFVPILVSESFYNLNNMLSVSSGFLAFSLLASSTYILNDILDLESDREHPRKKNRPIASGKISIKNGIIVSLILFAISLLISMSLGYRFSFVIISYLFITLFYSFKVKKYIGMDVVVLALLYTIRILAGAASINVIVSFWLFAFSIFIFLSLALVKRCSEIKSMRIEGQRKSKGRDYNIEDYSILESFGSSSAMLSVLMFCFYINHNALTNQYQQPSTLWLIVPGLIYWLMRMWIKTHRGEMHDDPIVFSLKDKGSSITIGFCLLIVITAQLL